MNWRPSRARQAPTARMSGNAFNSWTPENNGRYATKYPDSRKEYYHDLYPEDYGIAKMWVVVRPCGAQLNSENDSNSA